TPGTFRACRRASTVSASRVNALAVSTAPAAAAVTAGGAAQAGPAVTTVKPTSVDNSTRLRRRRLRRATTGLATAMGNSLAYTDGDRVVSPPVYARSAGTSPGWAMVTPSPLG